MSLRRAGKHLTVRNVVGKARAVVSHIKIMIELQIKLRITKSILFRDYIQLHRGLQTKFLVPASRLSLFSIPFIPCFRQLLVDVFLHQPTVGVGQDGIYPTFKRIEVGKLRGLIG